MASLWATNPCSPQYSHSPSTPELMAGGEGLNSLTGWGFGSDFISKAEMGPWTRKRIPAAFREPGAWFGPMFTQVLKRLP